jgi:hypothetical protein
MYKHRSNDTIYTGPVWDFDLAFNNDGRIRNPNDMSDYVYRSGGSYVGNMRSFVDRIVIYTSSTQDQLLAIWDEARHNGIDEDHLVAFVDSMEEELQQSQQLNFLRWPIMNRYVHQNPRIWGSYEAEVGNVRDFISKRIEWMDDRLGYTYVPQSISTVSDFDPDDIDLSRPYRVYSLSGQTIGADLQALPTGFYIVRQGPLVKKIQIK